MEPSTAGIIGELLNTYAFPIVMCLLAMWYIYDRGEKERADRKELMMMHKEEVDNLAEIISNNTMAITKLVNHLEED